jgi:hypothetical protein
VAALSGVAIVGAVVVVVYSLMAIAYFRGCLRGLADGANVTARLVEQAKADPSYLNRSIDGDPEAWRTFARNTPGPNRLERSWMRTTKKLR